MFKTISSVKLVLPGFIYLSITISINQYSSLLTPVIMDSIDRGLISIFSSSRYIAKPKSPNFSNDKRLCAKSFKHYIFK